MAVTLDAVSGPVSWLVQSTGVNATATHVVSASATVIVLYVENGLSSSSDANISAYTVLTLGGKAFTHLATTLKHANSDASTVGYVDIYYMTATTLGTALPSGSLTLSATEAYTGAASQFCGVIYSASYIGSDANAPTALTPVNGNLVATQTLSATLATGDMMTGYCGNGTAAPTVGTGTSDASRANSVNTGSDNVRLAHNTGTGATTIVFNVNSGDSSCATGVKLVAAGSSLVPPAHNLVFTNLDVAHNW